MRGGVAGGLVALALLPAAPALAAEGDPVTGWWSRTRIGAPAPTEAPDPVPEGGTWVARDPAGPVAVSALRVELADDVRATSIVLEVDSATGPVAVQVCPTAARWPAVDGGPLEQAPAGECETASAEGGVEGEELVIALPDSTPAGPLDVVLLPGEGAAFSVTLKPATAASVTTESAAAPEPLPDPVLPPASSPAADSGPPPLQPAEAAPAAPPAAPQQAVADPPLLAEAALPPPTTGPPADVPGAAPPVVAGEPAGAAPPVTAVAVEPQALSRPDDRRQAIPAALLLAGIAALALRLLQTSPRPVQALGGAARSTARRAAPPAGSAAAAVAAAFGRVPAAAAGPAVPVRTAAPATPRVRGLGRFRTARTGPPVRL